MKFTVYKGDTDYMSTECVHLIPFQYLRDMYGVGYRFRLNGKSASISEVMKLKPEADAILAAKAAGKKSAEKAADKPNLQTPERSPSTRKRVTKKVYCEETQTTYDSMSAAGRALNIDPAAISYAVSVNRPTKQGYHFKVLEE